MQISPVINILGGGRGGEHTFRTMVVNIDTLAEERHISTETLIRSLGKILICKTDGINILTGAFNLEKITHALERHDRL